MPFPHIILRALRPEPALAVSVWADEHRVLDQRAAAEPGRYRTSRTPYMREIMDDLAATSPVLTVVFKKASQIGASEAGCNWLGYIIDQAPGPAMLVQPTVELAKRFSRQRIDPLIDASDRLKAKVAVSRSREGGNTMLLKEFLGGILVITGANSAAGLRSMPVRYLFLDEIDAYPSDVEGEGDPVAVADARTRTFSYRAKRLLASTPNIKGMSRISRAYENTDQRRYFVPCPLCGVPQPLEWEQLRWKPGLPSSVLYHCVACEGSFPEHHKTAILAAGEWRATAESSDPTTHGYHLSALYSPIGWLGWADIARQWEEAINDVEARKTFRNTILGEEWEEEADAIPEWERLYERREEWEYNTVPERGVFLTGGVDVQADRIECDVWAWGRGMESWLVEHMVFWGDPATVEPWSEMSQLLNRTWRHASGKHLTLQRLAVDTGAFTQSVYLWVRAQPRVTVIPVKGNAAYDRLVPVAGPSKIEVHQSGRRLKGSINLWTVSVSFFKREFYKQLALSRPTDEERAVGVLDPPGAVHLPRTVSDEWVRQLVSEHQVIVRSRRGFSVRTEWRQLRPRNEALDMRVYARAAAWLAGLDRWNSHTWTMMEEQLGVARPSLPLSPNAGPVSDEPSPVVSTPRPPPRRRMMNLGSV